MPVSLYRSSGGLNVVPSDWVRSLGMVRSKQSNYSCPMLSIVPHSTVSHPVKQCSPSSALPTSSLHFSATSICNLHQVNSAKTFGKAFRFDLGMWVLVILYVREMLACPFHSNPTLVKLMKLTEKVLPLPTLPVPLAVFWHFTHSHISIQDRSFLLQLHLPLTVNWRVPVCSFLNDLVTGIVCKDNVAWHQHNMVRVWWQFISKNCILCYDALRLSF